MNPQKQSKGFAGLKDQFNQSVPPTQNPVKQKSAPPFSLRLTTEERNRLNDLAGTQPLGAYIRSKLFGTDTEKRRPVRRPGLDHQKLALVLSELGRSRLASNMNQLAKAANCGTLDFSENMLAEIREACRAITQMREMLIVALGLKPESGE
jgi:hypothetical protein